MRARSIVTLASVATLTSMLWASSAAAQPAPPAPQVFRAKLPPVQTQRFADLAAGPYNRLVLRNVMVVPGHGGPTTGPHDILITGNIISEIRSYNPAQPAWNGDRVIDGNGMYVMPGMWDLHHHVRGVRGEAVPLEYTYYLKLAHGVTTTVPATDGRFDQIAADHAAGEQYRKLAPRMFPIWGWGRGLTLTREQRENPAEAPRIAREMVRQGARVVSVGGLGWNPTLFGAVCKAVWDAGGTTTVHIPPSDIAMTNAVDAARLGVTFIEHHYGYAESALPRATQNFPRDYHYDDFHYRFRQAGRVWEEAGWNPETRARLLGEVADSLVRYGVTMLPTRVVYEVNRDVLRAQSMPWHEKYTHRALMNGSGVGSPFYLYNWTHDDEESWRYAFDLWAQLIYQFNKRGGRVAMGTDDNNFWSTGGFSNVRELQLVREAGLHSLEVLKAATYSSAQTLREPNLGLVRPGYLADLAIVDGNPVENFHHLYAFGAVKRNEQGELYRTRGVVHTIKDGVVIENANLMREVARIVEESKRGTQPYITEQPFIPGR